MAIHCCKAVGCERRISVNKLMCAGHWSKVPKGLQGECYAAFSKWKKAMSVSATEAVAAGEELRKVQEKCIAACGYEYKPVAA